MLKKVSLFFLYNVVFALATFIISLFVPSLHYSHTPPTASADVPLTGVTGDGTSTGGGDGCDGSTDSGEDGCDSF